MRIFNGSDIVKISRLSKHVVGLKEVDSFITKCFSEDEIWDIGAIAAFFALSNRMVSVTAMWPNHEFYLMGRVPKQK